MRSTFLQIIKRAIQDQQVHSEAEQAVAEQEARMIAAAMQTILTPGSRDRLARVELGHPELAASVKQHLFTLHQANKLYY